MKVVTSTISAVSLMLASHAYAQSSTWQYETDQDPLTDQSRYIAFTEAPNGSWLIIACSADVFRIVAKTNYMDITMGDVREVTWRVDHEPAISQTWRNLKSSGAAIFDNEAVEMAKSIQKANSRVVVKSGRDVREFSAKGSTGAISQLMQQCPNEVLILQ